MPVHDARQGRNHCPWLTILASLDIVSSWALLLRTILTSKPPKTEQKSPSSKRVLLTFDYLVHEVPFVFANTRHVVAGAALLVVRVDTAFPLAVHVEAGCCVGAAPAFSVELNSEERVGLGRGGLGTAAHQPAGIKRRHVTKAVCE